MNVTDSPVDVVAVDDEPTTRAIIAGLLKHQGIAVATCADGEELRALLRHVRPRVLILDVEMPGDDGFVLAEEMRQRFGLDLGIVMLTSHGLGADMAVGMAAGVDEYLTKPCDRHKLVAAVRRHLHGAALAWG